MKCAKYIDSKRYTVELMALKSIYTKIIKFAESEKDCREAGYDIYRRELGESCGIPYYHYIIGYNKQIDGNVNGIVINLLKRSNYTQDYEIELAVRGNLFMDYLREIAADYYPGLTSSKEMPYDAWELLSGKATDIQVLAGYISTDYETPDGDPEEFAPFEVINNMRLRMNFTRMFPMGGVIYDNNVRLCAKEFTIKSIMKLRDIVDTIINGIKRRSRNVRIQPED